MKRSRILVRLPEELHARIKRRAKQRLRSVNSEVIVLLKLGMASERKEAEVLPVEDGEPGDAEPDQAPGATS